MSVQLTRFDKAGRCMDCATTDTNYACMTCRRYLCTGCARSPRGCPNCNDTWNDVEIRGKLGTHPTAIYFARACDGAVLEGPPSAGDEVMLRSDQDARVSKWTTCLINEIRLENFYFMEMR